MAHNARRQNRSAVPALSTQEEYQLEPSLAILTGVSSAEGDEHHLAMDHGTIGAEADESQQPTKRPRGRPRKDAVIDIRPRTPAREKPPVPIVTPVVPPEGYVLPGNSSKSVHQKAALMRLFRQDPTPKKEAIRDLVMRTGLDYRECLKWFVGQRGLAKRKKELEDDEAHGDTADGQERRHFIDEEEADEAADSVEAEGIKEEIAPKRKPGRPRTDVSGLTKVQAKRAREWACQYSLVDDPDEKDYMIHQLVEQLPVKRRKELRELLIKQQPLRLDAPKKFKVRKPAADPSLTRDALIDRADKCWDYLMDRFGAQMVEPTEDQCLDEYGNPLLDASMVAGLETMFSRHRDYFMALVYRFNVKELFRRPIVREARAELEPKRKAPAKRPAAATLIREQRLPKAAPPSKKKRIEMPGIMEV